MAELLTGKIAIVSGAAHPRGIGRAIVNALSEHGASVTATDLEGAAGLEDIDGNQLIFGSGTLTVVPEPSVALLSGIGFLLLLRRKKR